MAGTPIGRILLMPRGDYSASAVYNSLDWVRYAGAAWVCKLDNTTGVTPSTSATTEWALMSADGSVGGWSTLANKPFETIGVGLEVPSSGAEQGQLKLDPDYLIGSNISYSNTTSGLTATNVQDAIDEVDSAVDTLDSTVSGLQTSKADKTALDEWVANGSPLNGSVTFTFDDTSLISVNGFTVWVDIAANTVYKNPYAKLISITGEGTASCQLTYETNAENGTNTAHLRMVKN